MNQETLYLQLRLLAEVNDDALPVQAIAQNQRTNEVLSEVEEHGVVLNAITGESKTRRPIGSKG